MQFQDHWKKDISFSIADLIQSALSRDKKSASLALGPGASSVTSTGDFLLRRQADQILITGTITHLWTDPGYDFDRGKSFDREAGILERHGKAKPFQWKAEWRDAVVGLLQIENPFSPNATRRWISFEMSPAS